MKSYILVNDHRLFEINVRQETVIYCYAEIIFIHKIRKTDGITWTHNVEGECLADMGYIQVKRKRGMQRATYLTSLYGWIDRWMVERGGVYYSS